MTITATVRDVHRVTPDVKQFRLVADDHEFDFEPGQHTMVHFENDGEEEARPYTAINRPGTDELVLVVKRYEDGNGSVYMHERSRGDEVDVEEVSGSLHVRDFDRDAVFLATGTGITPLYPMFRQYAREGRGDAQLVFGERDREHLILRESLDQLQANHGHLSVEYVLSRADDDWPGRTGHVQDHLADALDVDPADADVYVCGVPEMVVDTTDRLADLGVDEDRIYTEGWEADAADE